ncbi:FCD domain-containing protein [Propionivibrio sp.]|uniref:FCD domain-containing protein n=1 Tax=Propionivibrio sp. TaxID=2212460 RepID=UPI003BF001E0
MIECLSKAYETGEMKVWYKADANFYEAIAQASHNSMFLYLHSGILRMLREHISLNLMAIVRPLRRSYRFPAPASPRHLGGHPPALAGRGAASHARPHRFQAFGT